MALISSTATGNFNAGATWVGGVVPGVGDEARAENGHTITITANVTCDEVSNAGTGIFTLNDGVTLTANVTAKSTTANRNVVQFTAASPAAGTIVGNVLSGGTSTNTGAVRNTGGTLTITGNVTGGTAVDAVGVSSSATMIITGNVNGGTSSFTYGVNNAGTGTITITGNVTGGSGATSTGARNVSTGTINITGTVTGGSLGPGTQNISTGTITITGNCIGGSGNSVMGATQTTAGTIIVIGNAIGGTGLSAFGVNNSSNGTARVLRAVGNGFGIGSTGISSAGGVSGGQNSLTEVEEIEYGALGANPTNGNVSFKDLTTNVCVAYIVGTSQKTLVDPASVFKPRPVNIRGGADQ